MSVYQTLSTLLVLIFQNHMSTTKSGFLSLVLREFKAYIPATPKGALLKKAVLKLTSVKIWNALMLTQLKIPWWYV